MAHVFVSYVRENRQLVDQLASELSASGVRVWLDRTQIQPGQRWETAIRTAITKGGFFMACFSKEAEERDRSYMNEELVLAMDELRKRSTRRTWFVPVILTKCNLPDRVIGGGETLQSLHFVDLSEQWDLGVVRLLEVFAPKSSGVRRLMLDLQDPHTRVRIRAADDLGKLRSRAKPAVPALLAALKDINTTVRGVAAESLGRIGVVTEAIVFGLLRVQDDGSSYGSEHAIAALVRLGAPTVPLLVKALDTDRFHASLALRDLGAVARDAVPALIRVLSEDTNDFSDQALGSIGDPAAIPALVRAMNSESQTRRMFTARALARIRDRSAVPGLAACLGHKDSTTHGEVVNALTALGQEGRRAVRAWTARSVISAKTSKN